MTATAVQAPTTTRRPTHPTILPPESITYDELASIKHQRAVFHVRSEATPGRVYKVVHEFRTLGWPWTCTCPATVGECKHIRSVRHKNWYAQAYRAYMIATPADLRLASDEYVRVLAGELAPVDGWDAESDALCDAVAARYGEVECDVSTTPG